MLLLRTKPMEMNERKNIIILKDNKLHKNNNQRTYK